MERSVLSAKSTLTQATLHELSPIEVFPVDDVFLAPSNLQEMLGKSNHHGCHGCFLKMFLRLLDEPITDSEDIDLLDS